MKLVTRALKALGYILGTVKLDSHVQSRGQEPLYSVSNLDRGLGQNGAPIFQPPTGAPGDDFTCDYTAMGADWQQCSTPDNRGCWLKNSKTGKEFNINTDYEMEAPVGVTRHYEVNVTDAELNADGLNFPFAKLFNNTYPGPFLQACWGDTMEVKVQNHLKHNGTSIHWHGVRQNQTNPMDGVNGITQCAVAPGDHITYTFKVIQYGSTWYHSHFSLQYADGTLGPMTFHGPSSAPYDEPKEPLLMTDYGHNSEFDGVYRTFPNNAVDPSILFNGRGNVTRFNNSVVATLPVPEPYTITFQSKKSAGLGRAKRYLLRLINTSFDSTFIFSIDNHKLQIVGSDFVPIHPYMNTSVLIGIGQRYHVIVEADPQPNNDGVKPPSDGNFWIRTWVATNCGNQGDPGYEKQGILRYNPDSKSDPTSKEWTNVAKDCSDETYTSLVPVLKWQVEQPANKENPFGQEFNVTGGTPTNLKAYPPLSFFALGKNPLRIDYGNPIFQHLNQTAPFNKALAVLPENYTSKDWVWLVIEAVGTNSVFGAHPIHLHGHDFAVLQQANEPFSSASMNFKLDNPPRRDVVLLPMGGFIAIAFKTDNPGSWLIHCHIARHASQGLAMQILERQSDANKLWPAGSPLQVEAGRVCNNWQHWQKNCHHWDDECTPPFQDDSGI